MREFNMRVPVDAPIQSKYNFALCFAFWFSLQLFPALFFVMTMSASIEHMPYILTLGNYRLDWGFVILYIGFFYVHSRNFQQHRTYVQ